MDLSHEYLKKLMRFRPSLEETASYFGTSADTISRRIKSWENITFSEFRQRYSFPLRMKLVDHAIDMALSGNATMMIFCLKNYCGWADKPEDTQHKDNTIQIVIDQSDMAL